MVTLSGEKWKDFVGFVFSFLSKFMDLQVFMNSFLDTVIYFFPA